MDCDANASLGPLPLADGFQVLPWCELAVEKSHGLWLSLADTVSLPNPFFEPWFLISALEALDGDRTVQIAVLVESGTIKGLMPLHRATQHHARRLPNLATWTHHNSFCGSPLIAHGSEEPFWAALLDWCDANAGDALFLHLPQQVADASATTSLRDTCRRARRPIRKVLGLSRALIQSQLSPDDYFAAAISTKHRKELRRQRKRLDEQGKVEFVRSRGTDDIEGWIDAFLELEARGWKGQGGSALSSLDPTETLFRTALVQAASLGKLERFSMTLDGNPIAMLATFLTGAGAYSFKTAFDEYYARYSPGMQLQIENLALLADPAIEWCDSCAAQDHAMIDRIWRERRQIEWLSIPIGNGPRRLAGNLWTAIEALRWRHRK